MAGHVAAQIAQIFFWLSLNHAAVPRVTLEMLEAQLRPVSYETLLADLTVANWKETK